MMTGYPGFPSAIPEKPLTEFYLYINFLFMKSTGLTPAACYLVLS